MTHFKISETGQQDIRKQARLQTIAFVLFFLAAGIGLIRFNAMQHGDSVNVLPYMIPAILVPVFAGLYRGAKRGKRLLESYRLTLDEHQLSREQADTPTLRIKVSEIREISRHPDGSLLIKGHAPGDRIAVPAQLEDLAALERQLAQIRAITDSPDRYAMQKKVLLYLVLPLGLMGVFYFSTHKIVVWCTGLALLGLLAWQFVAMQKSTVLDSKIKGFRYWLLLIVVFVLGQMYMKLGQ